MRAAHGKGHWVRSGEERAADGLQSLYALEAEIEAAKHDTGSAAAPARRPTRNGLLQIPARFGTRHRAQIEALGLYDTGASKSFIDAGYVKRHGLKVHVPSHRLLRVMNGDGSFQEAQGEVTLFMHVGARFVERVTFVVIDLDKFDFIMGLPEIEGFRMELKGEPMRIHIYGSAQRKGGPPKTVAPAVIHSGVGADGKPEVFVLDFNAREMMQWHERGTADVFCLYEDPFSERDALISDPQEEIEWRAYLLHLQDQAVAAGLDGAALREAEAARAAAELEFKVGERAGEGHGKDPEYSEDQVALARKHPGVFSDELPPEPSARFPDGTEFARLRLKHGEVPRSRKQYRIPEALRPQLQKTIEELLQHGLIEPQVGSPYNSPILFAPKPNSPTGEMRFCFDARELNKVLEDHPYPNPTTEEMSGFNMTQDWQAWSNSCGSPSRMRVMGTGRFASTRMTGTIWRSRCQYFTARIVGRSWPWVASHRRLSSRGRWTKCWRLSAARTLSACVKGGMKGPQPRRLARGSTERRRQTRQIRASTR